MNKAKVKLSILISTPEFDETLNLAGNEFVFGRSATSTVHLNDPSFSRSHFKLAVNSDAVYISDMGSSNGTYVDGNKLMPEDAFSLEEDNVISVSNSTTQIKILKIEMATPNEPTQVRAIPSELKNSKEHNTDVHHIDTEELNTDEENIDENIEDELSDEDLSFSLLTEQIIEEANIRVDQIIQAANVRSEEIIAAATSRGEKIVLDKQNAAELQAAKFSKDKKIELEQEIILERKLKMEELNTSISNDRKKMRAELQEMAEQIASEHEALKKRLKEELVDDIEKIKVKKDELAEVEVLYENQLKKINDDIESQFVLKKAEIQKLEVDYQAEVEKINKELEIQLAANNSELRNHENSCRDQISKLNQELQEKIAQKDIELKKHESLCREQALKINQELESQVALKNDELKKHEERYEQHVKKINQDLEAEVAQKEIELKKFEAQYAEKLKKVQQDLDNQIALKNSEIEKQDSLYEEHVKKIKADLDAEVAHKHSEIKKIEFSHEQQIQKLKNNLEADLARINLEYKDREFEREEQFKLQADELDAQIAAKKHEIHKLQLAHEEQKSKQFQMLEAQVENKKFQLKEEINEYEEKLNTAKKEFASLFENYSAQKNTHITTIEELALKKESLIKEIKTLEENLVIHTEEYEKQINKDRATIEALHAEMTKIQKSRNELDASYQALGQKNLELQQYFSEVQKLAENEEVSLKKKKQMFDEIDEEIKRLNAEKGSLNGEITPLKNELIELKKKVDTAAHQTSQIKAQHEKDVEGLKTAFLQNKVNLEDEMRKLRDAEEKRLQNLTRQELNQINKLKEDSLRLVLELENSITKEISDATSKVFATTIGVDKFREVAPQFEKGVRTSLQAGVLKLLKNELAPKNLTKSKTLSSSQKNWKPFSVGLVLSAVAFGLVPFLFRYVQEQNDPVKLELEAAKRAAARPVKKFTPVKVDKLGETIMDSVIYTNSFYETFSEEKFRSGLIKEGSVYLYKQWKIDEEKSIQSFSMIMSLVDLIHEKAQKIDPDFEKRELDKLRVIEKETMKKLETILGNEVRLEAALKYQTRYYQEYITNNPIPAAQ